MKYLKLIMLFAILSIGLIYTYKSTCQTATEKGPGFEIQNQSQLNIMFRLFVKGKQVTDAKLAPGNIYQWVLDLNDPIAVEVYEPSTRTIQNKIKIDAQGKTKYLVWNPKKFNKPAHYFFPQGGRSDFRFFLEDNIDQADIKWVKAKG